eukprot:GHVS01045193.1.p1 GENE.GHVS01045193.1~~GHVS01045193.1.p1  ORF type:complete len:598 (+),score=48.00 GHVS01045193.1:105-1898(+)
MYWFCVYWFLLLVELAKAGVCMPVQLAKEGKMRLPELTGLEDVDLSTPETFHSEADISGNVAEHTYKYYSMKDVHEQSQVLTSTIPCILKLLTCGVCNISPSEPNLVNSNIGGLIFKFPRCGAIESDPDLGANMFHYLAEEAHLKVRKTNGINRDTLPWKQALNVAGVGFKHGLVVPMGVVRCDEKVIVVFPSFSGFTLLANDGTDLSSPIVSPIWTADELIIMVKRISQSAMFLHNRGYAQNRFSMDSVLFGTSKKQFLLCFIDHFIAYGAERSPEGSFPGELRQKANDKSDLYSIAAMLSGFVVDTKFTRRLDETLWYFCEGFRQKTTSWLSGMITDKFANGKTVSKDMHTRDLEGFFHWLNIAKFTAPYAFYHNLMFSREANQELTVDSASRLHIFCTFALIADKTHRPTLTEALRYLGEENLSSLLTEDVHNRLVPYSVSILALNGTNNSEECTVKSSGKTYCILDELAATADRLSGIDVSETQERDIRNQQVQVLVNAYKRNIDELRLTQFPTRINLVKNIYLKSCLTRVHNFNVLFPHFVKYLEADRLKTEWGFANVDDMGKAEYDQIPNKECIFQGWFAILEALLGKGKQ